MCEETCENVREETSLKKRSVTARHYISVTALHIISMTALHYIGNHEKMIGQYRCTEIKKGLKMRVLKLTVKPLVLVLDVTVPETVGVGLSNTVANGSAEMIMQTRRHLRPRQAVSIGE